MASAIDKARELGIDDISVTWAFPIALAAFGYTRTTGRPGEGILQGFFASSDQYQGKYPVFAVATDTEAVLITLNAARVMDWLAQQDVGDPADEDPKLQILHLFASEAANPRPAELVRTLLHTCPTRCFAPSTTARSDSPNHPWPSGSYPKPSRSPSTPTTSRA